MIFRSPYQYVGERRTFDYQGQCVEIIGPAPVPANSHQEELELAGLRKIVRFSDGYQVEAWPEELHDQ